MNHRWMCILLLIPLCCRADKIVQPGFVPSAIQIPGLPASLVDHNQQGRDTQALQQVASAMEQVLTKRDDDKKKESDQKKDAKAKESKETKIDQHAKSTIDDHQLAMTTEFLRAQEFSVPISIKTKKIAVRDALLVLAKQARVNILIDHDIQGFMSSLRADNLPASAVLQMVLDAHKPPLMLLRIAGAWRVIPKARGEELARSIVQGEITADRSSCRLQIIRATWDDKLKATLQSLWQGIVGEAKDKLESYLVFNDISNSVFVSGRSHQVKKFAELVSVLDKSAPQIRLDMRVVVANKNFESDFGLQWSGLYDRRAWAGKFGLAGFGIGDIDPISKGGLVAPQNGAPGGVGAAANQLLSLNPINTNTPDNGTFKNLLGWALNAIPANLAAKAATLTTLNFPITFGGRNLEWGRLNLQLMAAEQNNEMKTIIKPTLLVNNQEMAEILVGKELPHKVGVQEAVQGSVVNAVSTFYKDIGTKIQVRPSAMAGIGQVALDIFLEHSYITQLQNTSILNGSSTDTKDDRGFYTYNVEAARTRNKVVLKSGQTTMIGGLTVNVFEQLESGIPFLKDIPVLGALFRGKSKILMEKQLLIFITPTLVDAESAAEQEVAQTGPDHNEQA